MKDHLRPSLRTATTALLLFLAACGHVRPWERYPSSTPPDLSCHTGVEAGDVIYVWNCVDGRHVVVHQFVSLVLAHEPVREVAACGEKTPYEEENMGRNFECHPSAIKWETAPRE